MCWVFFYPYIILVFLLYLIVWLFFSGRFDKTRKIVLGSIIFLVLVIAFFSPRIMYSERAIFGHTTSIKNCQCFGIVGEKIYIPDAGAYQTCKGIVYDCNITEFDPPIYK